MKRHFCNQKEFNSEMHFYIESLTNKWFYKTKITVLSFLKVRCELLQASPRRTTNICCSKMNECGGETDQSFGQATSLAFEGFCCSGRKFWTRCLFHKRLKATVNWAGASQGGAAPPACFPSHWVWDPSLPALLLQLHCSPCPTSKHSLGGCIVSLAPCESVIILQLCA